MRSTLPTLALLLVLGSAAVPVHAQDASPQGGAAADVASVRSELLPVPAPDLGGLDPEVADQLKGGRGELETALADVHATAPELAEAYGKLGQLYHAYSLLDAAAACYANAGTLAPQDYRWPHLLGDVMRRMGHLEAAAEHFQAAWSLRPDDFAALVYLGDVERELSRPDDAEAAYHRALTLSPSSPSVLAGLGQLALGRHDYAKAASYLEAALAAAPAANRLHYSLAMAYRGLGKTDEAKQQLAMRGTVGVRPSDPLVDGLTSLLRGPTVRILRGKKAFAAGRFEDAREEFAAAVEAAPDNAGALVNLGTTLARLGDTKAAAERYRQALAVDPDQATASFNLGTVLLGQGDAASAVPLLERAVKAFPDDAEAHLTLARAYVTAGDDASSLSHFQRTAELDPASEAAVLEGAGALVRLKEFARARPVLEAGLRRMPESHAIAFALGRLLAAAPDPTVRDGARALKLARSVYDAQPTPRHAQLVAQALAESGRCDEAAKWQQKVVEQAKADGATAALDPLQADLAAYRAGAPCRPPLAQ